MSDIELRTPVEIERDERNKRICSMYVEIRTSEPDVTLNRAATAIANKEGVTPQTVKRILTESGLYEPTPRA